MTSIDVRLAWLQEWYLQQCDGDWEHEFGVSINTLDNPGWSLSVELSETGLEGVAFEPIRITRSESDWLHCWVQDSVFQARGGALNLADMLDSFRVWSEGA